MPRYNLFTPTALLILSVAVLFCVSVASVRAQQPDATKFDQTYETAVAKARADCVTLWSDHAFDRIRDKIPLGEDKPTFAMLTNSARLGPRDKPLADLAIKTLERCRAAYAPAFAMLPPEVNAMMQGLQLRQDALIAELYSGKITFGDYNVGEDRMNGEFARVLSGIPQTPQAASSPAAPVKKSTAVSEAVTSPRLPPTERNAVPATTASREIRLALVIGDSNYSNLPKLVNPANDARAIAELLRKIGFTTKLVLDASEADLRREVRKFASDSLKADIAFVFYAGHGAQVSGENYVLPVDMSIPQTEADIQLTGLKVDDLVNSMRAKTKVVFLDACRDNPALFTNLVKGRGSYSKGLAPAVGSNFQQVNPGGGVFIAYATDSGSVASDGQGEHSPFTQALLRNLTKPISIDDMFSLVTREVRLVTKNAQRPYKYASLDNIVCLTGSCSTVLSSVGTDSSVDIDVVQQAEHSESDDFQIALQTKNPDALEAYLQKYPESAKRNEVSSAIARLKRSEFDEWTLYEIGNLHLPQYLKISSIEQIDTKVAVRQKVTPDPSAPDKKFPDAAYLDQLIVYDCKQPRSAIAESTVVNKSGETVSHFKWANPQFLDMSIGMAIKPGTVGYVAWNILCHEELQTPLVTKTQLVAMNFSSLSSMVAGDGDIFYTPIQNGINTAEQQEIMIVFKMFKDTDLVFKENISITNPPSYRTEVDMVLLKCDKKSISIRKSEYYDASNNLVYLNAPDLSKEMDWINFLEQSPYSVLQRIVCKPNEVQQ